MKKISNLFGVLAILLTLIILLGAEGCQQGTVSKETGIGGLTLKFLENTPPSTVTVNQNFQIYAEAKNTGDSNIKEGAANFYLSGISPNIENVKSSLSNKNFLGKDASERLDFADSAKSSLELIKPLNLIMILTACYKYGGRAQAEVCIASSNKSQVCNINSGKITYNTVEPIQVTGLTEEISGNKIIISFIISNKGKGVVYLPNLDCNKLQKDKDINEALKNDKIGIRISTVEKDLTCRLQNLTAPYNSIDSLEGSSPLGKVVCEKTLSGEEDHKSVIQIILDYVYVETITQGISISPA